MKKGIVYIVFSVWFVVQGMAQEKFLGGDISLLEAYIERDAKYYDESGSKIDNTLEYFKSQEMNTMRVRLFVNPENATAQQKGEGVFQDLEYVKKLGKRIKDAGMKFMLDFHYSDSWADPSKQFTPKAWLSLSDEELYSKVYEYTEDCLKQLNEYGAAPDFIQTGNEISFGMLWGKEGGTYKSYYAGKNDNRERFTMLLKNAVKACRKVCPEAKVILHVERVADEKYTVDFFKDMEDAQVDYDIIGLSYYPTWHGLIPQLSKTLSEIETNFDKDIMIVEIGYYYAWMNTKDTYYKECYARWPVTENSNKGQGDFIKATIEELNQHSRVKGLFWWAMDQNEFGVTSTLLTSGWWNMSLFDNRTGRATSALPLLKNFVSGESSLSATHPDDINHIKGIYNLSGQKVSKVSSREIYIVDGEKVFYNSPSSAKE
ncbi:MAG: glycosyl hydrolase 53 family protein [Bacteroidales bacterium]|nr:glycosyl hydrolase 53 family protein [Bacteroidales bacterium]